MNRILKRSAASRWLQIGLIAGIAVMALAASLQAEPTTVPIKVYKGDGKDVIYVGDYTFDQAGPVLTEKWEYRLPNGDKVRMRTFQYDTDKQREIFYEDINLIKSQTFRAKITGDKINVRIEDLKGNADTDKTTPLAANEFIWPKFAHLLAANWDKIVSGNAGDLNLYAMSRQTSYGMKVSLQDEVTVSGIAAQTFSLAPTSFIARSFAPKAILIVEKAPPHRVVEFQGDGDLVAPNGDKLDATVVFEWPKS